MIKIHKIICLAIMLIGFTQIAQAQNANNMIKLPDNSFGIYAFLGFMVILFLVGVVYQFFRFNQVILKGKKREKEEASSKYSNYLNNLNSHQIDIYLKSKKAK